MLDLELCLREICLRKRVVIGVSHIAVVYVGKKTVVNSIVLLRSSL